MKELKIAREVRFYVGLLLAVLIMTAFGAVGLFVRISPAIEEIIEDNDRSLQAIESMLEVLALGDEAGVDGRSWTIFNDAFKKAQANVTEERERKELEQIGAYAEAALTGNDAARAIVVLTLQRLAHINHEAMVAADAEVKRFGRAGAWSAVFLGFIGFLTGIFVLNRLRQRVFIPIEELRDTMSKATSGEQLRRCHIGDAPEELAVIMRQINNFFDERDRNYSSGYHRSAMP